MEEKRKPEREPWEYLRPKRVIWKQLPVVLLAIVLLVVLILVGDLAFAFFGLGKDWSETLLIRMIVERRLVMPFFK